MLSVVMLSVVMLSVVMLSVVMLSVVMPIVVAPFWNILIGKNFSSLAIVKKVINIKKSNSTSSVIFRFFYIKLWPVL
jgi:hypothetical protein